MIEDDDTLFRAVATWNPRKQRPKSAPSHTGFLSVGALRQRFSFNMPAHERLSIAPVSRQMQPVNDSSPTRSRSPALEKSTLVRLKQLNADSTSRHVHRQTANVRGTARVEAEAQARREARGGNPTDVLHPAVLSGGGCNDQAGGSVGSEIAGRISNSKRSTKKKQRDKQRGRERETVEQDEWVQCEVRGEPGRVYFYNARSGLSQWHPPTVDQLSTGGGDTSMPMQHRREQDPQGGLKQPPTLSQQQQQQQQQTVAPEQEDHIRHNANSARPSSSLAFVTQPTHAVTAVIGPAHPPALNPLGQQRLTQPVNRQLKHENTEPAAVSAKADEAKNKMSEITAASIKNYVARRKSKTDSDAKKIEASLALAKSIARRRSTLQSSDTSERPVRRAAIEKAEVAGDEARAEHNHLSEWLSGKRAAEVLSVPTQLVVVVRKYDGSTSFTHRYVSDRYAKVCRKISAALGNTGSDLFGVKNCTLLPLSAPAGSLEIHVAIRLPINQVAAKTAAMVPAVDAPSDEGAPKPGTTVVHTKTLFSKEVTGGWPSARRVSKKMVEWLIEIGVNVNPLEAERCKNFEKALTTSVTHALPEAQLEHWVKILDVPFSDVVRFEYDGPIQSKKTSPSKLRGQDGVRGDGEEGSSADESTESEDDVGGGENGSPLQVGGSFDVKRRATIAASSLQVGDSFDAKRRATVATPKLQFKREVADAVFTWRALAKKPAPTPPQIVPTLATSKATLTDMVRSNRGASNGDELISAGTGSSFDTQFPNQWAEAWEADGELAEQQMPSRSVHVCRVPRNSRLVLVGYRDGDGSSKNVSGNDTCENSQGSSSCLTFAAAAPPCVAFKLTSQTKAESELHGNVHWYCHQPPGHPRAYFGQDFGFSTRHEVQVQPGLGDIFEYPGTVLRRPPLSTEREGRRVFSGHVGRWHLGDEKLVETDVKKTKVRASSPFDVFSAPLDDSEVEDWEPTLPKNRKEVHVTEEFKLVLGGKGLPTEDPKWERMSWAGAGGGRCGAPSNKTVAPSHPWQNGASVKFLKSKGVFTKGESAVVVNYKFVPATAKSAEAQTSDGSNVNPFKTNQTGRNGRFASLVKKVMNTDESLVKPLPNAFFYHFRLTDGSLHWIPASEHLTLFEMDFYHETNMHAQRRKVVYVLLPGADAIPKQPKQLAPTESPSQLSLGQNQKRPGGSFTTSPGLKSIPSESVDPRTINNTLASLQTYKENQPVQEVNLCQSMDEDPEHRIYKRKSSGEKIFGAASTPGFLDQKNPNVNAVVDDPTKLTHMPKLSDRRRADAQGLPENMSSEQRVVWCLARYTARTNEAAHSSSRGMQPEDVSFMMMFKTIDLDGNGFLTKDEWAMVLRRTIGVGPSVTDSDLEVIFDTIDVNKTDGAISLQEFAPFAKRVSSSIWHKKGESATITTKEATQGKWKNPLSGPALYNFAGDDPGGLDHMPHLADKLRGGTGGAPKGLTAVQSVVWHLADYVAREADYNHSGGSGGVLKGTKVEKVSYFKIFQEIDLDATALITKDEWAITLRRHIGVGSKVSDSDLKMIFDAIDTDHSGGITLSEFASFYRNASTALWSGEHSDGSNAKASYPQNHSHHTLKQSKRQSRSPSQGASWKNPLTGASLYNAVVDDPTKLTHMPKLSDRRRADAQGLPENMSSEQLVVWCLARYTARTNEAAHSSSRGMQPEDVSFMMMFKTIDLDGNGFLTKDEWAMVLRRTIGVGPSVTDSDLEVIFDAIDVNKTDGAISLQEFAPFAKRVSSSIWHKKQESATTTTKDATQGKWKNPLSGPALYNFAGDDPGGLDHMPRLADKLRGGTGGAPKGLTAVQSVVWHLADYVAREADYNHSGGSAGGVLKGTKVEKVSYFKIFQEIDLDATALITKDEWAITLRRHIGVGSKVSDSDLEMIFDAIDTDHSGGITLSEFASFYRNASTALWSGEHSDGSNTKASYPQNHSHHTLKQRKRQTRSPSQGASWKNPLTGASLYNAVVDDPTKLTHMPKLSDRRRADAQGLPKNMSSEQLVVWCLARYTARTNEAAHSSSRGMQPEDVSFMMMFKTIDLDGNGFLTKDEWAMVLRRTIGVGPSVTDSDLEVIFDAIDVNKTDGAISLQEFAPFAKRVSSSIWHKKGESATTPTKEATQGKWKNPLSGPALYNFAGDDPGGLDHMPHLADKLRGGTGGAPKGLTAVQSVVWHLADYVAREADYNHSGGSGGVLKGTKVEKVSYFKIFQEIDLDATALITKDEWAITLRRHIGVGSKVSDSDLEMIFDAIDTDHSGGITLSEFASFYRNASTALWSGEHSDGSNTKASYPQNHSHHTLKQRKRQTRSPSLNARRSTSSALKAHAHAEKGGKESYEFEIANSAVDQVISRDAAFYETRRGQVGSSEVFETMKWQRQGVEVDDELNTTESLDERDLSLEEVPATAAAAIEFTDRKEGQSLPFSRVGAEEKQTAGVARQANETVAAQTLSLNPRGSRQRTRDQKVGSESESSSGSEASSVVEHKATLSATEHSRADAGRRSKLLRREVQVAEARARVLEGQLEEQSLRATLNATLHREAALQLQLAQQRREAEAASAAPAAGEGEAANKIAAAAAAAAEAAEGARIEAAEREGAKVQAGAAVTLQSAARQRNASKSVQSLRDEQRTTKREVEEEEEEKEEEEEEEDEIKRETDAAVKIQGAARIKTAKHRTAKKRRHASLLRELEQARSKILVEAAAAAAAREEVRALRAELNEVKSRRQQKAGETTNEDAANTSSRSSAEAEAEEAQEEEEAAMAEAATKVQRMARRRRRRLLRDERALGISRKQAAAGAEGSKEQEEGGQRLSPNQKGQQEQLQGQLQGQLQVGEQVEARYKGRLQWFPATVASVSSSTKLFDLRYADGDMERRVPGIRVRRPGEVEPLAPLAAGTRVEARFNGGKSSYGGVVINRWGDGTHYMVEYDDGDKEPRVHRDLIFAQCRRGVGTDSGYRTEPPAAVVPTSSGLVSSSNDQAADTSANSAIELPPSASASPSPASSPSSSSSSSLPPSPSPPSSPVPSESHTSMAPSLVPLSEPNLLSVVATLQVVHKAAVTLQGAARQRNASKRAESLRDEQKTTKQEEAQEALEAQIRETAAVFAGDGDGELFELQVGEQVEARYKGRLQWFPATVASVSSSTKLFDLRYADGDIERRVPGIRVRRPGEAEPSAPLAAGTRVEARFNGGKSSYGGVVINRWGDGTHYMVEYDDGDKEPRVHRDLIFAQCRPKPVQPILQLSTVATGRAPSSPLSSTTPITPPPSSSPHPATAASALDHEEASTKVVPALLVRRGGEEEPEAAEPYTEALPSSASPSSSPASPLDLMAPTIGRTVEALFGYPAGSRYFPGVVTAVNDLASAASSSSSSSSSSVLFSIQYDDGDTETKVPLQALSLPAVAGEFAKGQQVEARFPGNYGTVKDKHYGGVVQRDNGDGTFAVRYDDGDTSDSVRFLRRAHAASADGGGAGAVEDSFAARKDVRGSGLSNATLETGCGASFETEDFYHETTLSSILADPELTPLTQQAQEAAGAFSPGGPSGGYGAIFDSSSSDEEVEEEEEEEGDDDDDDEIE